MYIITYIYKYPVFILKLLVVKFPSLKFSDFHLKCYTLDTIFHLPSHSFPQYFYPRLIII